MVRYLLNSLRVLLRLESSDNGSIKTTGPVKTLTEIHYLLSRLAHQLDNHSEKAPYPHVTASLRRIALDTRHNANLLKSKIESLGGKIKSPSPYAPFGKNHWERLAQDLEDQKTLDGFLTANEPFVSQQMPDVGTLLRQISTSQAVQTKILVGLIARADPQADQT